MKRDGSIFGRVARKVQAAFGPLRPGASGAPGTAAERDALLARLRRQLVAVMVAALALVLVVAFAFVCDSERQDSLDAVDATLDTLDDALDSATEQPAGLAPDAGMPGKPLGNRDPGEAPVAVAVYRVAGDGTFQLVERASSGMLARDDASQAISAVLRQGASEGSVPGMPLLYAATSEDSAVYVAFASGEDTDEWVWLAWSLSVVGVLVLLAAGALAWWFAGRVLAPVKEAWERQDAFIADASHELKTPVSVILANDALLRAHPEQTVASQMQWIDATHDEALRLQSLIGSLLELARSDAGAVPDRPQTAVDLSYVTEGEALQFESVAFERALTLETAIEPQVMVAGDAEQLRGLVRILLDNACKYACADTTVKVELTRDAGREAGRAASRDAGREAGRAARRDASHAAGQAVLRVTDFGVAIDPEQAQHLFERFYRADAARTRTAAPHAATHAAPSPEAPSATSAASSSSPTLGEAPSQGGFGLGLAIAAETVRRHGGTIRVLEPAPGTPASASPTTRPAPGTPAGASPTDETAAQVTFEVRLPLAQG